MFDIETLGTKRNSAVLSVGAVLFNQHEIVSQFYVNIDLGSNLKNARAIDSDTFYWWMQQASEAQQALLKDRKSVDGACRSLLEWISANAEMKTLKVWGNGATFDNVIMRDMLQAQGYGDDMLWRFWNERCYRTIIADSGFPKIAPTVAHNAMDDAIAQTETLLAYWGNQACKELSISPLEQPKQNVLSWLRKVVLGG